MPFDLAAYEAQEEGDWAYHVILVGKGSDPRVQQLRAAVEYIQSSGIRESRLTGEVESYFEAQYEERLRELKLQYGGVVKQAKPSQPLLLATAANGKVLYFKTPDDFFLFLQRRFKYQDTTNLAMYKRRAWKENMRTMMESGRLYCSLGFSIARGPLETVSFELFQDLVPITVAAFRVLLDHPPFLGSLVHRIVPGGWIQGGDWSPGSPGGFSQPPSGELLKEENLGIPLDTPGLLCMCTCGPNTIGSQFFVTVKPMPFFTGKYVVVGRVIAGMRVIRRIAAQAVDPCTERPLQSIRVEEIHSDLTNTGDPGMRAELEKEIAAADADQDAAAAKVQSVFRGRSARQKYGDKLTPKPKAKPGFGRAESSIGADDDTKTEKKKMKIKQKSRKDGEPLSPASPASPAPAGSTSRDE